jgi:alcohol dehydrogenase
VPDVEVGRVLGHEAVGTVTEVGSQVRGIAVGDRVLVSCISACGRCASCREGRYGRCRGGGGWVLGHLIDGTQAELVRVPFADRSLHVLPNGMQDEAAVVLADILPTAYEVGARNGGVRVGDTVMIVGAGPIGLASIATCRLLSPLRIAVVDPAEDRRKAALDIGADVTFPTADQAREWVTHVTEGQGVDVAIEAVGLPETFELCADLVRPGGHVANVGVHGRSAELHLETLWDKDITITTGLVDTTSTPRLLQLVAADKLSLPGIVTHRFGLDEIQDAYDVFERAAETGSLKVVLFGDEARLPGDDAKAS